MQPDPPRTAMEGQSGVNCAVLSAFCWGGAEEDRKGMERVGGRGVGERGRQMLGSSEPKHRLLLQA